jgi:Leucine-rich repeat (LRR) protein
MAEYSRCEFDSIVDCSVSSGRDVDDGAGASPTKRVLPRPAPDTVSKPRCLVLATSSVNKHCVWTSLPTELVGLIIEHLSVDEIQMARLVCRDWRRVISSSVACLRPHYFDGNNNYHSVFNQVTRLDLRGCASTLNDHGLLYGLQPFSRIHKLDLSGCSTLTDKSLRMLFENRDTAPLKKSLTWLSLQNVGKITDASVFALCGVPISSSGTNNKGCGTKNTDRAPLERSILRLRMLGEIHRDRPGISVSPQNAVTHDTPRPGRGAIRLEYLDLSGCCLLSDSSMSVIRRCLPNLKDLRLGGYSRTSSVGDSMLRHLVDEHRTSAKQSYISDSHRHHVRNLESFSPGPSYPSNIEHLDLSGCITLTSSGLEPVLTHMQKLDRLNLWNCMSLRSNSLKALSLSGRHCGCLQLRELSLRGCHGIDDGVFQYIAALSKLESLDMRSCEQITGRTIGMLWQGGSMLSSLRHLNMKSCFGLVDLHGISRLSSLEVLNLGDCWQIRVEELGHLSNLSNLIELDLSGCRNICNESGRGIPALSSMKRLVTLCLHCCERLREGALSSLVGLPKLCYLDISRCSQLPASDLKYLWNLKSLAKLKASHCSWSGCSALRFIGPVESLEELILQGCPNLVGTSFEPLKRLRNLKTLVLDGCSNTPLFDRGLNCIASSLNSLTRLSMQNCITIGDSGIASLGQLHHLEFIDLSDCYGITGEGFRFWTRMGNLRVVILQGCSGIHDKGVGFLVSNNNSIRELNLKQCRRITDKSIFCIANHLPRIKSLSLQASMGVTDAGILCIAERARQIHELSIQFCWQFGDESVIHLAKMPWLKRLDLLYSWKITDTSIDALAASSSLVELNIFGCHRISCQARQRIASKLSAMCKC